MVLYAVRRLLWSIPVIIIASILVFVAVKSTTNPAAQRCPTCRAEDSQRLAEQLHLNESGTSQYVNWFGKFAHGDFGKTLRQKPVWPDLRDAIIVTLQLGALAYVITIGLGLTIGVISAIKQYSWFDSLSTGASFFGLSIPPFFFGLILQIVLVLKFRDWFGTTPFFTSGVNNSSNTGLGYDRLIHLILPAFTVAVQGIAIYSRYMRSSMLDVLHSDFLRTARAKGISERRVIVRHALRNALIPVVTYSAIDIGAVIGGLVITEQIFQIPGMGVYFLQAFRDGEYVKILPWMMLVVLSVIALNLIADLLYGVLDPRIRLD
ncbi:MAG: peptide/nickel transport system permease protein [Acidimicrobiaceae bacterium]|jgi:peptide/nickel transport system permease protein